MKSSAHSNRQMPLDAGTELALELQTLKTIAEQLTMDLPLLDFYIAANAAMLPITSTRSPFIPPDSTLPIVRAIINRYRSERLQPYFNEHDPGTRFYLLARAKGVKPAGKLRKDPPWIDEAALYAGAVGILPADLAKTAPVVKVKGTLTLNADPAKESIWLMTVRTWKEVNHPRYQDFHPDRIEGGHGYWEPEATPQPAHLREYAAPQTTKTNQQNLLPTAAASASADG